MYKNQEGYADPTAGQALANIRREEKEEKKQKKAKKAEVQTDEIIKD